MSYERQEARAARVFLWFGGLTVVVAAVLAIAAHELHRFGAKHGLPSVTLSPAPSPVLDKDAPRLQIDPPADMAKFRAEEDRVLSSYGWSDRTAGEVRIPIDRAMTMLLERERQKPKSHP